MASSQPPDNLKSDKRSNLMSIIESLQADPTPGTSTKDGPNPTNSGSSDIPSSIPFKPEMNIEANMHNLPTGSGESQEPGKEGDVITNILRLLYQVSSSNPLPDQPQQGPHVTPPENDETLLQMQHPPEGNKAGIQPILHSYANGTADVRAILNDEINIIYECKRCRGMFRSIPNLIRHKKEYCRNTGLLSTFMSRQTNSTREEDVAFQKVLDVLHPPEPSLNMDFVPIFNPPLKQTSSMHMPKNVGNNFQPVRVNLVKVTSSGMLTSHTQTVANTNSNQMVLAPGTIATSSNGNGHLKFFVGPPGQPSGKRPSLSLIGGASEKRHICPICDKAMAERKSVRRHLVKVHMMSQIDAITAMNNVDKAPRYHSRTKSSMSGRITAKPGTNLLDMCVESIKLGPNRIIHVLPENFALSSVQCPVCERELCRKTNVRRHILEAHNLIIKNEKKYFQLREISTKNMSDSPSLRALRFLFTSNNPPSTVATQGNHTSTIPVPTSETVVPKLIPVPILPLKTTQSRTTTAGHVALNQATFVETPTPRFTLVPGIFQKALPTKVPILPEKKTEETIKPHKIEIHTLNGPIPTKKDDAASSQDKIISPASENREEDGHPTDSSYKCSPCKKTFSRRRTFKNHMSSFHNCSGEEFERKYKFPSLPTNNTETRLIRNLSSDDSGSDTEPPRKLRKLSAMVVPKEVKQGPAAPKVIGSQEQKTVPVKDSKSATVATRMNGSVGKPEPDGVPLATTTTILSSTIIPSNNSSTMQQEKVTALTQNFVLRRLSLDNLGAPQTSTVAPLRPFIKVELRNSTVAAKASEPNLSPSIKSKPVVTQAKSQSSSGTSKGNVSFDFDKRICYSCNKTFSTSPDLKRHLLGAHSLSDEKALAACYDCSDVDEEVQKAGIANGFDITQAKCLICNRLYFSRENLARHLSRMHHLEENLLRDLKKTFIPKKSSTESKATPATPEVKGGDSKTDQLTPVTSPNVSQKSTPNSASSLLQKIAEKSTSDTPPAKVIFTRNSPNSAGSELRLGLRSPEMRRHNRFLFSKDRAVQALKIFPKEYVNVNALRCAKCRHKYNKAWDLKMHLLKHLDVGLYSCRFCPGSAEHKPAMIRSGDLLKHLTEQHHFRLTAKNREHYFAQCRVDLKNLWETYGLPVGKVPVGVKQPAD